MREIKFRAWDGERLYTKVLVGNVSDPNSEDYTAHCIYRDGDWFHSDEHDSIVFEQYTGLKDKNGVEIYEGDIVVAGCIKQVVSLDVYTSIERGHGDCGFTVGTKIASGYGMGDDVEVIGNIHQNQELIND